MPKLADFRRDKDHFMEHDTDSPLDNDQKRVFRGLSYYDERPDLRLVLDLERYAIKETLEMQTSTRDVTPFLRWGKVGFRVDGELAHLTVFKDIDGGEFFLPFADATGGVETYGAGRYLEIETLPDGRVLVDFNYSYNPYCAYNDRWSCPITPLENRLKVPIRAGEKMFK